MKISGNSLRPGMIIEHKSRLWVVTKTQQVKPGKGGAYMQAELKGVLDTTKLNERFRASEDVERVRLDEVDHQFLYADGNSFTFMNQSTFEQTDLNKEFVGDLHQYLEDGMPVSISFYEDKPIGLTLPESVILEVTETEPIVKGQTAAASYKPAELSNGMRTMVPPHVERGMRIVISTLDGSYIERAKD